MYLTSINVVPGTTSGSSEPFYMIAMTIAILWCAALFVR